MVRKDCFWAEGFGWKLGFPLVEIGGWLLAGLVRVGRFDLKWVDEAAVSSQGAA